jgi:protein SCO1/2
VPTPCRLTALAGLACVVAFAAGCGSSGAKKSAAPTFQAPAALGALPRGLSDTPAPTERLTDIRTGAAPAPFDTASLRGTPYFVSFLYVHCTTTCPLIGEELQETLRQLGPLARKVAVVAISVQPEGDTPASVLAWLKLHHEPSNFHYLIGTRAQLTPVWHAWLTEPQPAGGSPSVHTAAVWIVDARGRRVKEVPAGAAIDPAQLAAEARHLLA